MKTFLEIVRKRKQDLVKDLTEDEKRWILQSLVDITLNYRFTNIGMYNHVMR